MVRYSWIGLALVLAIGAAPAARAGYVTPDSIGAPVLSPIYGAVASGGLVTNQYQGLGLLFSVYQGDTTYSTAAVQLNNHDVFAGAYQETGPGAASNRMLYNSPAGVRADLVLPGTTTPDMADSVKVIFDSNGAVLVQLQAFDKNGRLLTTLTQTVNGQETPVELDVASVQSIYATAFQPVVDPPPGITPPPAQRAPVVWGVSSIEWHEAPEPAGFVLGGLGVLALMGYALRRRLMHTSLGVRGA